jgi:hypothetical protein
MKKLFLSTIALYITCLQAFSQTAPALRNHCKGHTNGVLTDWLRHGICEIQFMKNYYKLFGGKILNFIT